MDNEIWKIKIHHVPLFFIVNISISKLNRYTYMKKRIVILNRNKITNKKNFIAL